MLKIAIKLQPVSVFIAVTQWGKDAVRAAFSEGRGGAEAAEGKGTSGGAQPGMLLSVWY